LCKGKKFISKTNVRILLLFSLPAVGIFLIIAMFRDTLPHWAAPGYYGIILITASWLSYMYELKNGQKNWMHKTVIVGNFFLLIVCLIILFIINYSPFALSSQNKLGKGDVTLEMYGYRQLGEQFAQLFYGDTATHVMKPDAFILANKWFTAAHYDYYVAQPLHLTLAAAGPVDEIHHYHWLNQKRRQLYSGCDAYFIAAEDLNQHASEIFGKKFEKISAPDTITILRNKLAVRKFYVYRMNNYRAVK
jgi:4-amino-4-deoxy-L-arabinose transferase-like glycosyltransferase